MTCSLSYKWELSDCDPGETVCSHRWAGEHRLLHPHLQPGLWGGSWRLQVVCLLQGKKRKKKIVCGKNVPSNQRGLIYFWCFLDTEWKELVTICQFPGMFLWWSCAFSASLTWHCIVGSVTDINFIICIMVYPCLLPLPHFYSTLLWLVSATTFLTWKYLNVAKY